MDITITPTKLSGSVTPPPSKSQAHRALIAAALADGESVISNVAFSQDIEATLNCLESLGAEFVRDGSAVTVRGMGANSMSPLRRLAYPRLDCGESGSTLRFLIPVTLAVRAGGIFTGRGRLMERPQRPYFDLFDEMGIFHGQKDGGLTVTGMLTPGTYQLPGDVSSQFVTGLLYALPLLDGDSSLTLTTPLESADYVSMTLDTLKAFGIQAKWEDTSTLLIPGGQTYRPCDMAIEADWSQAAFWYAAQALGNPVTVEGMNLRSIQGDREFLDWVQMVKNEPMAEGFAVTAPILWEGPEVEPPPSPSGDCAVSIDVSQNPDLVPPLAAMGALMNGLLQIQNAARLRIKESDRLASVTQVLGALGADITEEPDSLTIQGRGMLAGGVTVDSFNDHRIAMMAAIAATRCEKPVTITGAQCVAKSYPNFWEEYERLGGKIQTRIEKPQMETVKLVIPTEEHLDQVWAYRQECQDADSSMDGCGPLRFNESPEQWLADVRAYMDPATVPEGKVQATQFLTVRKSDGRLVGMINVRHYFNEYLKQFGGHIGYSICPDERRKGYAKEQLRLALGFCKETLGLDRVLITCNTSNEGSRRTILSAGGIYENTVHEPDRNVDLERYWVTTG